MHSFASGSSIVTLTRHPSGGATGAPSSGTTLAFTDADGNVITSVVDGVVTSTNNDGQGVTIVTTDSLVGSHFLDSNPVTKIEIDDDVTSQMALMTGAGGKKLVKTESDKKICLWDTGNGTTCGKTFTKFDR